MANYTNDEIQAAVEKIIRSTVRHPLGSLGERQVNVSFNDLQEAASGVYILSYIAPYYTLYLGVTRLLDALSVQASTIAELIDAVQATKRQVTPVKDLTNLANARAALEELQSAVSARSQGFNDIQAVPSFRRYASNIDAFLTTQSPNIKAKDTLGINGLIQGVEGADALDAVESTSTKGSFAIVDTPGGARAKIPDLVRALKEQQDELVRRVGLLAGAIEDFGKLNLPQLAAQGVITRARAVLTEHYDTLAGLDENTRLAKLRDVALDLMAQRPLVERYGAGLAPSQYVATEGLAHAFSDALHPASPASVLSTEAGPYNITEDNHLMQVAVDGNAPFNWPLPLGYVAELNGVLDEPFNIGSSSNRLTIVFDDPNESNPYARTVVFTTGLSTAASVVAQINAAVAGSDLVAEEYFRRLKYDSIMAVSSLGGNNASFAVLGGNLNGLGINVGDELDVLSGPQNGTTWTIYAVDPSGFFVHATGPAPATPMSEVSVQIGSAARAIRLRDDDPMASLDMRRSIRLKAGDAIEDACANILGFYAGMEVRSQPVMAADVVTNINTSTSLFAAELLDTKEVLAPAYADLADPTKITLSYFLGDGPITGGTIVTFTYEGELTLASGDLAVIRSSSTTADIGVFGTVADNDVVNSVLTLSMSAAITAGTVTLEVGPNHIFHYGDPVLIESGPNQGRYTVREPQGVGTSISFEVLLDRALPVNKTGSTPSTFSVWMGYSFVYFKSTQKLITSSITIDNVPGSHGAEYFISPIELPLTGIGTTQYLQFDTYPKGAAIGDLVQLFENQYNVVSRQFQITATEPSKRVLKITNGSGGVEANFEMTFNQGVPNPFGAIRIAQTANYAEFKKLLDVWLMSNELTTTYYRDLARLLNPVLTNANPTSAAVDNAVEQLLDLLEITSIKGAEARGADTTYSLEYALKKYTSPVDPAVDTLITTFRNKGADRAIDLLLEGQFSTFFGLNLNTLSYSGTFTEAARDVAMNDLVIRKTNRRDALSQQTIGTIPNQPDHEHEFSDADGAIPDIPGNPDVSGPGDAY